MKRKHVKILSITQNNIKDGKVVAKSLTEDNFIKQNVNNFMLLALERTFGEYEPDDLIREFIKVTLPKDEEEAKEQWFEGIEYQGYKYLGWFSPPGMMKKEDQESVCQTFFIRSDRKAWADEVEDVISLGVFKEKQGEKLPLNKDILSRLGLITSECDCSIKMPNYVILKQPKQRLKRDYYTIYPNNDDNPDHDYSLKDYRFDDEIDIFDGGSIAGIDVFKAIGKEKGRNDIDFAVVRGYGIGLKGMLSRFNIEKYLDNEYVSDTEYLRKTKSGYEVLDMWDEWQTIDNNTIILNESMVKLSKFFTGMDDIKQRTQAINEKTKYKFSDMLNTLYITKLNKPNDDVKDYREANYQLLNTLALSYRDLLELADEDLSVYAKILEPYKKNAKDESFEENIDYFNLMYKKIVNPQDVNELKPEDKASILLDISPKLIKTGYVRRNMMRLVEKRIRSLAVGRITIPARHMYIAPCPITLFDKLLDIEKGLQDKEYYSAWHVDNSEAVVARNPLSAYSEVTKIKFVRNELYDEYLCGSKEIIYFNQRSDNLAILSSADTDGDSVICTTSEIIKRAVVEPDKHFISLLDGKKKEMVFDEEGRFLSTFRGAGNLIGQFAIFAVSANCLAQKQPYVYDIENDKFIYYEKVPTDAVHREEIRAYVKEKIKEGKYLWANDSTIEERLREYLKSRFKSIEHTEEIFRILFQNMASIDVPKLLTPADIVNGSYLKDKYGKYTDDEQYYIKKKYFLQFKESSKNVRKNAFYNPSSSLLDKFAKEAIYRKLLMIVESKERFSDRAEYLQKQFLKNNKYDENKLHECGTEISTLYKPFSQESKKASCSEDYKRIDAKYIPLAEEILSRYDIYTIMQAIAIQRKMSENFIITLFFDCFLQVQKDSNRKHYKYEFVENPDDDAIRFLYKHYKREEHKTSLAKRVEMVKHRNKERCGLETLVRFRILDNSIKEELTESYELTLDDERIQVFAEHKEKIEGLKSVVLKGVKSITDKSAGVWV